ncbi:MAG: ribonuclease P protein component [Algiphilus sp.]|jgi:ribonuclease P protein component
MRLRLPREFAQVLGRGRRHRGRICTIVALPRADVPPRLGLAISKKAAPNAVRRNRIKRLTRASFLRALPAPGWYVVMARPGAGLRDDRDIVADLDQLWRTLSPSSAD